MPISDVFAVLQTNLGAYYVNDFNLYGKVWKVIDAGRGGAFGRTPEDIQRLYVLNRKGEKVPLSSLGETSNTRLAPSTCRITTFMPRPR